MLYLKRTKNQTKQKGVQNDKQKPRPGARRRREFNARDGQRGKLF